MILRHLTLAQDLALSHDLLWTDEHAWSAVTATSAYSLTGALIIDTATRQAGRPITLSAPDAGMAWHPRSTVDTLHAWSNTPGQQFLLTLDDARTYNVVFRHSENSPIESKPVRGFPTYDADDYWQVTLKFMEI
jgi:hypothetical protein